MAADPVIKEIFIDAWPSVVFQFLTDPEKMIRWMGIKVEIDPRPGGVYRVEPNGKDVIRGKYIEIVPDSRVVFTWGGTKTRVNAISFRELLEMGLPSELPKTLYNIGGT